MKKSMHYLIAILLLVSLQANTQDSPETLEGQGLMELLKISEAYKQLPNLSFNVVYTYADTATWQTIEERLEGSYKLRNGKCWGMLDSMEFLQGNLYNMGVYYRDSLIIINNQPNRTTFTQLPLNDSFFREANIVGMTVTQTNDSTRTLRVQFNEYSEYQTYEMEYDSNNFLIRKVNYHISDGSLNAESGGSGASCITIYFSDYSDELISEDYFDENKFVYKQGTQIRPKPAYANFRVMAPGNAQNPVE